jgi:hypothetical protein
MDPQWLIWLGSPSRYFTSTYLDQFNYSQNTKGSIGVRSGWYICDKKNYWGSWLLIIHTRAFPSSFGCVKSSLQDSEGDSVMELPTLWPWRLAEQRSNRQTDRTSLDLRPWIFWRDIFIITFCLQPSLGKTLKLKSTAGVKDVRGNAFISSWPTESI